MENVFTVSYLQKMKTTVFKNSFWGILANILQNVLFSIFFIVIARKYSTQDFADYVIANTLYSFVLAFSSLGLGWWFVREIIDTENKKKLISLFFKIQILIGVIFFVINIVLGYALYKNELIRALSLVLGINIIFDNIIYVIKFINIAHSEQKKTFIIFTVEAFLKFFIACLLFFFPIPILYLSLILIVLRLITLNLFIQIGCSNVVNLKEIFSVKLIVSDVKKIILANFAFIVIGCVSVVYWRIGNILVSKILTTNDVAHYEISFKLFSMVEVLPVIVSTSVYPLLIKSFHKGTEDLNRLYRNVFIPYLFFGLIAYTFVYSFSDSIIPLLFGEKYAAASVYCKQMFLAILIFPTAFLQANVLTAMKLERLDMYYNITSLVINLIACAIGFYFFKSLSVINYAIFSSFLIFHLLQSRMLLKRKISTWKQVLFFYIFSGMVVGTYHILAAAYNKLILFVCFWLVFLLFFLLKYLNQQVVGKYSLPVRNAKF